ncbi:MAG: hypothetical protein IPM57_05090 [Oligoflexia bacterium]|nr:hypothetical protein [Oligoflexia bacterium]
MFILIIFLNLISAHAQIFTSAQSQATGEAGRASYDFVGSHFLNPATLVESTGYVLSSAYEMARIDSSNPTTKTVFAITDNAPTSMVAAGFGYVNFRQSFHDKIITDQDFSLSIGARVLPKLSLGWLGRRLVRQNTNGPAWAKHNMNLGALIMPAPFMRLALVGYDVLTDDDLDMIPVLAIGSQFDIMGVFKLKADILRQEKSNPEKKTNLNAGMEFILGEGFNLGSGGIWDTLNNKTYLTLGLGWFGPRLSAAYAYKTDVNAARDFSHNMQLWIVF